AGPPPPVRARRAPSRHRDRVATRQRPRLGPLRRRVPGHPRRLPRRRRVRLGPGGAHRGRGRRAGRAGRPRRAGGGQRRRPVLAVGAQPRRPGGGPRPVPPPAAAQPPARPGDRRRGALRARHGHRAALRRRLLRRGVLLLRRPPVRRGDRSGPRRDRTRAPGGRPLRLLGHPSHPLDVPRRPGPAGAHRVAVLLGPDAVRRGRRRHRPRVVRRAPPHAGRLGLPAGRPGVRAAAAAGARVARGPRPGVGRLVARARPADPGYGDLRRRPAL
ncbi:MAG: SAM-dependent methyltransferase, partial [uncultured Nocardioides sp.]